MLIAPQWFAFGTSHKTIFESVSRKNQPRMTRGNVAVHHSVNEENGNMSCGDCGLGEILLRDSSVLHASVDESRIPRLAEAGTAQPWASMKKLADTVVGNFAKC